MKFIFKNVSTALLFLISATVATAADITGVITDNFHESLPDATVRLLASRDSSFIKASIADMNGQFRITNVNKGKYILEATYLGYNKAYKNISVGSKNISADTIVMSESSILLKETTVIGIKTPIKVMEDTVEFNADSYKTQPNAVVEDLLKRLPGVEIDTDGKITANGKEVTKILVDGKEFFSDDPKVASKNLPVNMVDKLQVVDRKSDLARMTGVDDGEDETVINLTVKKGMKNGWFGTVEAGYGTDDRYQGTFNINRFWNGNQLTFIGNANNTNELGFTDGNGNRFRRFGGNQGINNSQSFGVNFNIGKEEIIRFGGDVMYSHSDRDTRKRQNREYLLENPYTTASTSDATDKGHNVRADFRIEWKPDSFNSFDFRPRMSVNINDSESDQLSITQGKNLSLSLGNSHGKSYEASGRLIYNHQFKQHRGRSLSIFGNYQFSNVREHSNTYAYNMFYQFNDSLDIYDQFTDNHTWSNSVSGRISWTEPLGNVKNGNFLTVAYRASYRWNNADKLVYDRPVVLSETDFWNYLVNGVAYDIPVPTIDENGDVLIDSLSNRFRNDFFNQDIRVGYKKVSRSYTLDAGLSLVPSMSRSINLMHDAKSIPTRWVWNFAPFLRFRYKFGPQRTLNVDYMGRSSQPSMNQLQPVADYSDPLRVVQGNPDLDPTFNHNIRLRFQSFNPESQQSIMTMADVRISQNSIISRTSYNQETGAQFTTYENVNGVWNGRIMNMFSQPLRNKAFTFNNNIFANFSQTVGFNNMLRNTSRSIMLAESFSFAYRPENFEFELRPTYRIQTTFNSTNIGNNPTVHNYGGIFNGYWYTPIGIILNTDLNFQATKGYANGFDTNTWMWNASISYQFLKGKQATVMLKVYDILHQQQSVNRSVTANYIDDTEYNTLTRYAMLTFTYRFNTFGKGNEPASRNQHRFGPGGPPPGGGPR